VYEVVAYFGYKRYVHEYSRILFSVEPLADFVDVNVVLPFIIITRFSDFPLIRKSV